MRSAVKAAMHYTLFQRASWRATVGNTVARETMSLIGGCKALFINDADVVKWQTQGT